MARNSSNEWKGPSAREMIETRTLGKEIIDNHNAPCPVFDDKNILQLRRFVLDPDNVDETMNELDAIEPGWREHSLTAHIMKTWGSENSALSEEEVIQLREWFEDGGGKTDAEVAAEQRK